jgi:hypothetical protein
MMTSATPAESIPLVKTMSQENEPVPCSLRLASDLRPPYRSLIGVTRYKDGRLAFLGEGNVTVARVHVEVAGPRAEAHGLR